MLPVVALRGQQQPTRTPPPARCFGPGALPTVVAAYTDRAIQQWNMQALDDTEAAAWIAQ